MSHPLHELLAHAWLLFLAGGHGFLFVGGFDFLSDHIQKTDNNYTSYQDSFNKTDSWVKSMADSGNTTLTIGAPAAGASDILGQIAPLLFAVFALLGGLWLVTRKA